MEGSGVTGRPRFMLLLSFHPVFCTEYDPRLGLFVLLVFLTEGEKQEQCKIWLGSG